MTSISKAEKKAKHKKKKKKKKEGEKAEVSTKHNKKGVCIPFDYDKINPSSYNFVSVPFGRAPTFDGTHYASWRNMMKMHLISLHPSVWNVVLIGLMFEEAKQVKKITMANAATKNKGVALKAKSKKKKPVEEDDDENDDEEEDKEDVNTSYCLMAKTRKVMLPSNPSSSDGDYSGTSSSDDEDMFESFNKKAMLHVSKLMKAKEKTHERQEDLLILEKEKCLALESQLELEKGKVASLTMDLQSIKDSTTILEKDNVALKESLVGLTRHKELEEQYSILWNSTSYSNNSTDASNASTSKGCSLCYSYDLNAYY
uniref:Uncharacterized protein n=1 Tax=Leersia perrieri TaxID=77586 RepID=A0A0D9VF84_9ORYZ